ncbi:TPA: hypothetical protein L4S01_001566 [Pseudomonas aeruginosa]|nr:hypothetical protein [Pseudomonas aeruginosa]
MIDNATPKAIRSIKFYCMVPVMTQGSLTSTEVKSTFHAKPDGQELTYSISTGATAFLTVTVGAAQYIYKLSDIVGRVEVAL